MRFDKIPFIGTVKRLSQAIGYLELGMTKQALASLEALDEPGPFAAVAEMLRGEAARLEQRMDDAAGSFETAARMLPAPYNKSAWLALSHLYRQAGETDRAIQTLAHARGVWPPKARPKAD